MAQARLIKSRIKSATNIAKITKAMEMVAASKMRRSQEQALASRPYTHKLLEMLKTIGSHTDSSFHPLLSKANPTADELIVIVATDRGLAGSLNANLFRAVAAEIKTMHNPKAVTVGKRAKEFALKIGLPLVAEFTGLPDRIALSDVLPIAEVFVDGFIKGEFSSVRSMHMQFESTIKQSPEINHLLPIASHEVQDQVNTEAHPAEAKEYVFEPSPKEILDILLPYYIENGFFQIMLEAKASEHSARMVAMKNASDNAKDIVASLRLEYNKSRQAGITAELLDITTASLTVG
ncbi:ATP synthase F1 subunit gamma [Candidatus Woesebacteria bacterium]|nr:ATP synthase F1 subunit gamma [Candidatus Woesebacteria bacterium]